jgi:hypothetical protein
MEMDNELGITGKSYTTEFREYYADVGRWWSLYFLSFSFVVLWDSINKST